MDTENQPTKVCHVSSVHPAFDVRIFHKECRSLARAGFETYLVVTDEDDQEKDGVKVCGVRRSYSSRIRRMTEHAKHVVDRAKSIGADIYHLHDPELLPHAIRLKRTGAKVIYDSHEDLPRQTLSKSYIPRLMRRPMALALSHYEDFVCSNIDAVVTATASIRDRFRGVNSNVVVINNFPFVEELKNTQYSPGQEKAVCYVGAISRHRGAMEIVRSLKKTRDVHLYLAGAISDSSLREQMEAEPGWAKVYEMGFIPRGKVADVLAKSLAGLVIFHPEPNHLSAMPVKMFEYLSAGRPIICSNFDTWEKMLGPYNCALFVDPFNPKEITDAINWVADHPDEALEMGRRGQEVVEQQLNWNREEEKLIDLYRRLCPER